MIRLNHTADKIKYLCTGELTKPFLPNEYVMERVLNDYNAKCKEAKQEGRQKPIIVESLMRWIFHMTNSERQDKDFIYKHKFQRTAQEIWESKKLTGCTDYALLFATFSRQLGIPTTFLHTAEKDWLESLKQGQTETHTGHSFCECYIDNKWILVDPTCGKIEFDYNPSEINLSYSLGGSHVFIPYYRGLDLGEKQTVGQHNKIMDDMCKDL